MTRSPIELSVAAKAVLNNNCDDAQGQSPIKLVLNSSPRIAVHAQLPTLTRSIDGIEYPSFLQQLTLPAFSPWPSSSLALIAAFRAI